MAISAFHDELCSLEREFASRGPELELTVRDPDLGVEGYVVVWNTGVAAHGPLGRCGKGGTRITPTVTLEEIKMLSHKMALKMAGTQLPLGGAKSGLRADPDSPGFEKQYRRFVQLVKPVLRENGGIFGGLGFDIGARPIHALWACDELQSGKSFTGKPVELGGTDYDREGIAGLGVAHAANAALQFNNEQSRDVRFVVQGAGAMGAAVVRYFSELGGRLVAISDPRLGGSHELSGTPSTELLTALSSQDFSLAKKLLATTARPISSDSNAVLSVSCDVLFPCAVQDVVTAKTVSSIRARYITEGANSPCTRDTYPLLAERGIVTIPDFIANPGGVIAAYVEMTSKLSPEENVRTRGNVLAAKELTQSTITANVTHMLELAKNNSVLPVDAGRLLALRFLLGIGS